MKQKRKQDIEELIEAQNTSPKKKKVEENQVKVKPMQEDHDDLEFEDPYEDEYEEEVKVENDWEDVDGEEEDEEETKDDVDMTTNKESASSNDQESNKQKEKNKKKKDKKKKKKEERKKEEESKSKKVEIWDGKLAENEELVFDNSAYEMLHRAKAEWPCLSIDILLRDRVGTNFWYGDAIPKFGDKNSTVTVDEASKVEIRRHVEDKYPYSVYVVAGSQTEIRDQNKVYVMKWTDLHKTKDDDKESIDEDHNQDDEPTLIFESFTHHGAVNRIRSMHGSNVVATWSDVGEVNLFDIKDFVEKVDAKHKKKVVHNKKKVKGSHKIRTFKLGVEGYGLDWSPLKIGRFATGDLNSRIFLYNPVDEGCSDWAIDENPYLGHSGPVEDIQFSPVQADIFASCSVDKTIKLWDVRSKSHQLEIRAHDSDVNVISWNHQCSYLLASGSDDASFKIWDLRFPKKDAITHIRWHTAPITSIQFQPREDSVLAVSSSDNKVSVWDFSVEADDNQNEEDEQIPQQLMFLHQGQDDIKELRFHPLYEGMLVTTAADSFNIFRPNLKEDSEASDDDEDNDYIKSKLPAIKQALANKQH